MTPNEMPLASVIVPTYNAGRFVNATIESALRQTLTDIEVIAVDDGSTDDTVARLRGFQDRRLRIIRQPNQGAPAALNAGLRAARGRYVALLDHDDLWLESKLERQIEFLERNPEVEATFSWSRLIDESGRDIGLHTSHWRGPISFRQLLEDYVVGNTSSLVLRRATVLAVGGFDPMLPRSHDWDLLLRIELSRPNSICAIPEELTCYRRHEGQMSRDWRGMQQDWNRLLDKCRRAAPRETSSVERRAGSNMSRYFAYLAYEGGNFSAACSLIGESVRKAPRVFFADRRNWQVAAACLAALLLPAALHRRLERLAGIRRE
jgi:glycosyltransferase involved in cell wall biosynthesis